jgi:hypothetical protein
MPEEELWELAKLTAYPPEKPVELVYEECKRAIEKIKATSSEWMKDLEIEPHIVGKESLPDRILIIESEPSVGKELASILAEAGFCCVFRGKVGHGSGVKVGQGSGTKLGQPNGAKWAINYAMAKEAEIGSGAG